MQGTVSSSAGNEVGVQFERRDLSTRERRAIAIRTLGIFWGLSLVTIPLPPIHWITVPGFFLFGIFQAIRKLREPAHFLAFAFACPECRGEVRVEPQPVQNPLAIICPHCRFGLKLRWPPCDGG